jgi:uncharacterized protein YdhG (YjbR/CyaY superfamily)
MKTLKSISTIDEYIALQPKEVQSGLKELRQIINKNAPAAQEVISYGMPAFKLNGMLAYFAVAKEHYGFYAMPGAIKKFADKLKAYATSKGTIRFPLDKPLPKKLIADIIKFRVKENEQKTLLKKAAKKIAKKR